MTKKHLTLAFAMLLAVSVGASASVAQASTDRPARSLSAPTSTFAVDFVATAATGVDMNDAGVVVGRSRLDPGCGSTCLPPEDTVVWREGKRLVLPEVAGLSPSLVTGINNDGWVSGFVGIPGTTTHAVVWKPVGEGYEVIDLGNLPGKTISTATGIDDLGRVVGWSTTQFFPPSGAPFVWTESGGMVDLTTLGYPADQPMAISPEGTVGTVGLRYRLGDPSSVVSLPPPPRGFVIGADGFSINDAGDEARFLIVPSSENLLYLFRFHHEGQGSWQRLSDVPTGHLSRAAVGSINDAGDITATVQSAGMIAYGPDGLAQSLDPLVSPAYGDTALTGVGALNASGQILASMVVGQSSRVVRLVPTEGCTSACVRVVDLTMTGTGPAFCDRGRNHVSATLRVRTEKGRGLSGVRVSGHFLDDYWLDGAVSGTADARGRVTFKHVGPPCVGAVAFIVTRATKSGRSFDRMTGTLTGYVIPKP